MFPYSKEPKLPTAANDEAISALKEGYLPAAHELPSKEVPSKEARNRVLQILEAEVSQNGRPGIYGGSPASARQWLDEHLALLPARYRLTLAPELIAKQILLAKRAALTGAAVEILTVAGEDLAWLLISCSDFPGLFAGVAGMLAAMNVNIIGADLETRGDGIVVDVLEISTPAGASTSESGALRDLANKVEHILRNHSKNPLPFRKLFPQAIVPSVAPPLRVPEIRLSNERSERHTVVEIRTEDRLALAYIVTSCLAGLGLTIHSAILVTESETENATAQTIPTARTMAHDVFYLTEVTGEKVPQGRWAEVIAALENALKGTS